ncbi:MAG: hypothetical protein AB1515_00305 [Nitrospirota bacterium]
MCDVLVTGAESRQGLVVIRSLGRRGLRLFVTGDRPRSLGFYSKYIHRHALTASPEHHNKLFVDEVLGLAQRHRIPYIFPVTETSLIALDERRDEVDAISKLLAPPSSAIRAGVDKQRTLAIAEQVGVPITKTLYPRGIEEADATAAQWGYPVIFKPRGRANDSRIGGKFDFKIRYAHNRTQLHSILEDCADGVFPMMQEYAYGGHTQVVCFMEPQRAHSWFQDDAVRMLPLTGGVGTRMQSRPVDPLLAEYSGRIFAAMRMEGCAQAQFKGPDADGRYRFLEVSVRLPASVGSAVYSGIDYPWQQYCYFSGQPVAPIDRYRLSQPTRWLRGDTISVWQYLLDETPRSGDTLPSKPRIFWGWLVDFVRPRLRHYVEVPTDPKPALQELRELFRELAVLFGRKALQRLPILRTVERALTPHRAARGRL